MKKIYMRMLAVIMAIAMMAMCMTGCMPADTYAMDDEPAITTDPIETEAQVIETEAPTVAPILETEAPATETPTETPDDHKHSYAETVTAPTCTKEGYTRYTCACGHAYNGAIKDATGHNMEETDHVDYTCETAGHYTMTCSVCGYEETHEIPIHSNYVITCVQKDGGHAYDKIYSCECGYFEIESGEIEPHNYVLANDLIPCGTDAYYQYKCADCGMMYRETVEPMFAEHDYVEVEGLAPGTRACSHCGRTAYSPEWE